MSSLHVVVVGHGMVGARFAEEVRRHDPDGRRVRLTILAAEPRPAYNRVLLPNLLSGVMKEEDFATTVVAGLPVVAGKDMTPSQNGSVLHPDAPLSLHVGTTVTQIDPVAKTVLVTRPTVAGLPGPSTRDRGRHAPRARSAELTDAAATGERLSYDVLVLATGARPAVPPLPGLLAEATGTMVDSSVHPGVPNYPPSQGRTRAGDRAEFPPLPGRTGGTGDGPAGGGASTRSADRLSADVAVLHSLADARRVAAFAQAARRAGGRVAVLGGGVLGLEAARALAAHGTAVTVVHRGGHLMDRQLDAPAGRVLAGAMRRTGVEVSLGVGAARWEPGRGLWLTDGNLVRASGLVLCTGTVPCTELTRDAGLRLTETGAVAIDDTLATSAAGIYAIGDCAGHPGAAGGLVQPGWEQAAVLASRLTGAAPRARYRGSGAVTRLKAAGIELTAVGASLAEPGADAGVTDPGVEVLRFEDPARERYAKLLLAEERVVGAVLIGLPDAAAGIVQLYDRDAPAPADRLALLLGRALPPEAGGASGPGALPDHAVVCRCNMVTKRQLRDAWYRGACGRAALSAATRAATGCGTCGDDLGAMAAWLAESDPSQSTPTSLTSPTSLSPDSPTSPPSTSPTSPISLTSSTPSASDSSTSLPPSSPTSLTSSTSSAAASPTSLPPTSTTSFISSDSSASAADEAGQEAEKEPALR
jgi:assimilatory nitrate reductase electron transfer subunit